MIEAVAKRLEDEINTAPNGVKATAEKSLYHHKAWLLRLEYLKCRHLETSSAAEVREILAMWALLGELEEVA